MQACGRNQMISSAASQGVVSDEFAFDKVRNRKWTYLINRPGDLKFLPSRRKPYLNRRGHPMGLRV
jgi:hypothetical protein